MNLFPWGRGEEDAPAPVAAGSRPAASAGPGADADVGAGQRPRPAPLNLGEQVGDDAKWAASRARWNLAIKPDSPAFVQQKAVFEAALDPGSGMSIEDTLKEHFSNYETQKFNGWADRRREPDLFTQQKRDAEAYNTLLASPPWDREAPQAFLAFKMTMLYFGFSVEPMKMNDFFRLPPGSGLFGLDDDGEGDDDLDDQRTFVPEEMRPLRFLNRYDKRCYGADNGHMIPDPTFELYYGLPFQAPEGQQHGHGGLATGPQADMRIRGRGLGEDKDEDVDDDSMSGCSIGGVSFCSDSLLPDAPAAEADTEGNDGRVLNLRGGSGGSESEGNPWVCSFSGYTRCNFHFARGFYAAVDTALGLEQRLNAQVTVALMHYLPDGRARILQLESITLGNAETEKDLHDRLLVAYTKARHDSAKKSLAFFVCPRSKNKALVELQELQGKDKDAGMRAVSQNDRGVFKFERPGLDGTTAATGAYLWVPQAATKDTASNLYTKWFPTVVRITSGPHDLTDRLGRETAQLPRVSYAVQVGEISPSFHQESPLPREVWEAIVEEGLKGGDNVGNDLGFKLFFTSLGEQAFAQVPGYYPPASTTPTALDTEAVFKLAWDSVPARDKNSVVRIVARRPGEAGMLSFPCKDGSVDRRHLSYVGAERKLRHWLRHKYFFNIVPEWERYEVTVIGAHGRNSTFSLPGGQGWSQVRSRFFGALSNAGWTFREEHFAHWVLHLDQRIAGGQEAADALQRNRVAWDMELGEGQRENRLWEEFRAALSVRQFQVQPIQKQDDHGEPTFADPLARDEREDSIWNRWGCNRPSVNWDTGGPVVRPTRTLNQTQIETQTHDHGHHAAPAQAQGQGILHQGVPQLGAGVDIFQSGKYYREQSFATPLSVQVGDQKPRFPINAPPIEHIRRPRGPDGIESDSMPVVSTQIMTPTEQRTLQQAFFQMRSIALNRAQQCPHKDCSAFFPVGPGNMAAFHAHLDAKHVGTHCPFCDETLFKHWSATDRQKHFVDNHSEYFTAKGDLLRESLLADRTQSKGNVHPREEQYSFCPRCGRNHQLLSSKADRVHHDNSCFPGNDAALPGEQYCRRCGEPDHVRAGDSPRGQRQQHQCAAAGTDPAHPAPASNTFCSNCALECHQLPISYGRRHLLNCKPLASKPDGWCPWCGVDLKSGPRSVRLRHLATCVLKPASGQNPVCTDSGIPFESPRDHKARLSRHGLSNLGMNKREARISVPTKCPVSSCQTDLTSWNAQGLYRHFLSHPDNVLARGGGLKSCPFCACDFEMRGFRTSSEKHKHFDDHLNGRSRRVLADETIGSNPDREDDVVLDAISTLRHDEHDHKAEIDYLSAENVKLSESLKRVSADNRELRDEKRKPHEKHQKKPITPSSSHVPPRQAARASRLSPVGGTNASVSKRKDGAQQDLAEPPAKKSRVIHHGPSTTTVPGFATGRQVSRSVPDSGEDWLEDDDDDYELSLESQLDVEEGIIDEDDELGDELDDGLDDGLDDELDDELDDDFDDGLDGDDYDELAG